MIGANSEKCYPGPSVPLDSSVQIVRDHRRDYPGLRFVYPVISRRSRGLSIGINLNPDKRCNFNCVYCEVDRKSPSHATGPTPELVASELTILVEQVLSGRLALDQRFSSMAELTYQIQDFAFSGDGEPTLVQNFDQFAQVVAQVRARFGLEQTKLVLITNASGLDKKSVRDGLRILAANNGVIWAKLDAGTEAYYRMINRSYVNFDRILKNITDTAKEFQTIIQSLFLRWKGELMPPSELQAYCDRLKQIVQAGGQIQEVHVYTIARPAAEPEARPLAAEELSQIAKYIHQQTHLKVEAFP